MGISPSCHYGLMGYSRLVSIRHVLHSHSSSGASRAWRVPRHPHLSGGPSEVAQYFALRREVHVERKTQQLTACPWCAHALVPGDAQCPECHLPFDHTADPRPVRTVDPHHVVVRGADCHQPALVAAPIYLDPVVLPASHASQLEMQFSPDPQRTHLLDIVTLGVPAPDRPRRIMLVFCVLLLLGLTTLAAGVALLAAGF